MKDNNTEINDETQTTDAKSEIDDAEFEVIQEQST